MKKLFSLLIALFVAAGSATALDLTWDITPGTVGSGDSAITGGPGAWNISNGNWTTDAGANNIAWNNANNDNAVFQGTAGTVTLGEPISISNLTINTANYAITNNTLSFAAGGAIGGTGSGSSLANGVKIYSGISGNPNLNQSAMNYLQLLPTADNMVLDTITRSGDNYFYVGGATTGNSIASIPKGNNNAKLHWIGSGTWTVGNIYGGEMYIKSGNLVVNGELTADFNGIFLQGGTLHCNNPAAVKGPTSGSSATLKFNIDGGSIDNSSGSAIATSTWNPRQQWRGDWTFIGSAGANSDLNLGTGGVTLAPPVAAYPEINLTVSNELTTLTIGGVINGTGYGITKSGAGKLVLTAASTYSGKTIVSDGVLDVREASGLAACSRIDIGVNGTLRLENSDNSNLTWTFPALSGLNSNLVAVLEPGTASNLIFTDTGDGYTDITASVPNADSTAYWDGNDTSGSTADGGAGVWDNSASNWDDAASGGSSIAWDANATSNDTAIFGGAGAEVTLGSDIYLRRMEVLSVAYNIGTDDETHVLRFGGLDPRLSIFDAGTGANSVRIKAGITGSPDVHLSTDVNQYVYLEPGAEPMTLGIIQRLGDDILCLGGTNTGNTAEGCVKAAGAADNCKLRKYGSGTWTFNGPVYAGADLIIFNDGKLVLNGLTTLKNTTTLRFDASSTGTLAGIGVLSNCALVVPSACTIAPGDPTGTMTITNGSCTISGKLAVSFAGAACSRLAVNGTLNVSAATLSVDTAGASGSQFVIASSTSAITGPFAATNGLPTSWSVNYDDPNQIKLIPPPSGTVIMFK